MSTHVSVSSPKQDLQPKRSDLVQQVEPRLGPRRMSRPARNRLWYAGLFGACVVLPTAVMLTYAVTADTPLYQSEVQFAVRSRDGQGSMAGLGALAGRLGIGLASSNDIYAVRSYLESPRLFEQIDGEVKLASIAAQPDRDWWLRLSSGSTKEQRYRYYRSMVDVKLSSVEQIIKIGASGFSPEQAQTLAKALVSQAERFVNQMSERAKLDFVAFAEGELKKAEERVMATRVEVTNWRNANLEVDPQKAVEGKLQIINGLVAELSKIRTEIAQLEISPTDVQARIRQSRMREQALAQQIERERRSLAGEHSDIAKRISDYERLIIERDLAEKAYSTAVEALKAAQQEAMQKQKYVVITAEPSMPQERSFPRPIYHSATVAASGIGLYFVLVLLFSLLRDYRGTR
jgi:capsular polysaccharide transport system permease protein